MEGGGTPQVQLAVHVEGVVGRVQNPGGVVRKIVSVGMRGEKDALPEVTGLVVGRDISVSSWGGV